MTQDDILANKNIHSPISAVNVYSFGKRKLHASGLKIRHVPCLSTTERDKDTKAATSQRHRACLMPCTILKFLLFYLKNVVLILL